MRKVLLGLGVSLDLYIARPDGSIDFLSQPKDYDPNEFFSHVDAGIMGRKTFEDGLKMGGNFSAYKGWQFYVLSRTLQPGERDGVTITRDSPGKVVADLRKRKGKDIWLMGGGETIRDFLQADLVDEIHLGVVPVLLGEGRPLFPGPFPQRDFKLLENKTYGNKMVALRYGRVRKRPRT